MKFAVFTNPSLDNNVIKELISSGLIPELVVTKNPFFCGEKSLPELIFKKAKVSLKVLLNRNQFRYLNKPYYEAKKNSIKVFDSSLANTKDFEIYLKNLDLDYIFTFGFKILKDFIIKTPKFGAINFHPAFLPYNRGISPTNWVIKNGQNFTGLTFHFIDEGIDTGRIIEQYKIPLIGIENSKILNKYLFQLGEILLVRLIYKLKFNEGSIAIIDNYSKGSYQKKYNKDDCYIDSSSNSITLFNTIMASRQNNRAAIFNYKGNEVEIVNSVDISDFNVVKDNLGYPYFFDDNIVVKTSDNKIISLIIKRKN